MMLKRLDSLALLGYVRENKYCTATPDRQTVEGFEGLEAAEIKYSKPTSRVESSHNHLDRLSSTPPLGFMPPQQPVNRRRRGQEIS